MVGTRKLPPSTSVSKEDGGGGGSSSLGRAERAAKRHRKQENEQKLAEEEEEENERERLRVLERSRKKKENNEMRKRRNAKGKCVLEVEFSPEVSTTTRLSSPPIVSEKKTNAKKNDRSSSSTSSTTTTTTTTGLTEQWISMLNRLKSYKIKFGDCRVPRRYKEDISLGNWVRTQRQNFLQQKLHKERRLMLEDAGFEFVIPPEGLTWDETFRDLQVYKDKNGNCNIPTGYDESPQLLYWTFYQREMYRKGQLSQDRIGKLEGIGFQWEHSWPTTKAPTKSLDEIWNMQLEKLARYKETNGHLDVPSIYPPDQSFAKWIDTQRTAHRRGQLPRERIEKLEDLGLDLNRTPSQSAPTPEQEALWQASLEKLKVFKAENGHCKCTADDDPTLNQWIRAQRKAHRKNQLTSGRKESLESVGLDFEGPPDSSLVTGDSFPRSEQIWNTRLEELKIFKVEFGHCNVPGSFRDPVLARWVGTQRTAYGRGQMPLDRIDALEALGFQWRVTDGNPNIAAVSAEAFNAMLQKLKSYKEEHGNCDVMESHDDQLFLRWIKTQKLANLFQRLPAERKEALDSLGFDFQIQGSDLTGSGETWDMQFQKLVDYRNSYGNCNVPVNYSIDPALGRWVHNQRAANRRNQQLSKERKEALDSLGFNWSIHSGPSAADLEAIWNMQYEKLRIYKTATGNCNIPTTYAPDPALARWVTTQRTVYRKNQMHETRKNLLESLGFEWRLGPKGRSWEESLSVMEEFKAKHGHCFPSKETEDSALKNWVISNRQKYAKGTLSKDYQNQLEAIGFVWTAEQEKQALWDIRWKQLYELTKSNGFSGIPSDAPEDPELLEWISLQHAAYTSNRLSPERIEKLLQIGFVFNADGMPVDDGDMKPAASNQRVSWNKHYQALLEFKEEHGHTNVPFDWGQDPRLGLWVFNQRKMHRRGLGPRQDRIQKLESIGFAWTVEKRRTSTSHAMTELNSPPAAAVFPGMEELEETMGAATNPAETERSPQGSPAAASTPTITWGRAQPPTLQTNAAHQGVQQMAVNLEVERTKLENENKQLKRANQKLLAANQSLTKKLAEAEATFQRETKELREKLQHYDQIMSTQAETLQNHDQRLSQLTQNDEQRREQATTLQNQVQEMRQMQYTLQHQLASSGLSYRL